MAKRETKETYKDARNAAQGVQGQYDPLIQASQARAGGFQEDPNITAQREAISGGFQSMMGPAERINFQSISQPRATNVSELRSANEGYKAFRDTGGLSTENIARMRGNGGYDEFATTGGYTPASIANIKAQALSPIGSYATGTRDELARRAAVQGGYAPGFDAANRQLRRDTARGIADTSLKANVDIQDRVNEGRKWGISGLTGAEQALAGLQTGNRLAGLAGETTTGNAISGYDANDIRAAMEAEMYNSQGNAMADQFNITNQQNQYAQGLSGLTGLYGSDIGLQQGEYDRQAALTDAANRARQGYLNPQTQLATQPGIGGNIMGAVGTAAGIGSQFFMPGMGGNTGVAGPMNRQIINY